MEDVIVIGAGAIGAFLARNLSRYKGNFLVLEKYPDVGDATSMANSAIVHSGYDPKPGTKKAYFNVKGNAMFDDIAEELDVDFIRNGSMTIALEEKQLDLLRDLASRGEENGVKTRLLSAEEAKKLEPALSDEVKGALLCPSAGIVNVFTLVAHAFENAIDNGVKLHLQEEVVGIRKVADHYEVKTNKGVYETKVVVNAAGMGSELIARMVEDVPWTIRPRKGEYYVLDHFDDSYVRHTLFPLPSDKGKGILFTQTTSHNYLVGPSSEFVDDIDDLSTDSPTLSSVRSQATTMVPGIPFKEQIRVFAGLRSSPSTHDFIIEESSLNKGFINVAGIESPGLVSSPAIGEYVVEEIIGKIIDLKPNESYNPCVKKYLRPSHMDEATRDALIKENPDYGLLICNCEKVSLGEIKDVLGRSLPCLTIKALKKRVRAGFGKCQGVFCQPKVLLALSEKLGVSPLEVLYDREGSEILSKESK